MDRIMFLKSLFVTAGLTLTGGAAYAYHSGRIEIVRQSYSIPGLNRKIRVVAISDLHAPSCPYSIPDIVNLVNQESPDLFALVGDIIDECDYEGLVNIFKAVNARVAKFAVLGNWEYDIGLDLSNLKENYENAGARLLINKEITVSGLNIMGLDDFLLGSPDLELVERASNNSCPSLVISHCPVTFDFLSPSSKEPILVLSGHTHGGQIAPFGLALKTPLGSGNYVRGWYHNGMHSMYVMRGIGTTGIPIRMGARPELLVLDMVKA
jgi:predicted MPP superfamily phosphohydrolase